MHRRVLLLLYVWASLNNVQSGMCTDLRFPGLFREGDYYKAIANFEKVATSAVGNNLKRWSIKDYFLKSGICLLAVGDQVAMTRALEKYRDMDPTFTSTREHQLLVDLLEAVEGGDQEIFADKLYQYDQMSKLDKWKTTILLRVKSAIEEKGEDFS